MKQTDSQWVTASLRESLTVTPEDEARWAKVDRQFKIATEKSKRSIRTFFDGPHHNQRAVGRLCEDLMRHFKTLRGNSMYEDRRHNRLGALLEFALLQKRGKGFRSEIPDTLVDQAYGLVVDDYPPQKGEISDKACKETVKLIKELGYDVKRLRLTSEAVRKRIDRLRKTTDPAGK